MCQVVSGTILELTHCCILKHFSCAFFPSSIILKHLAGINKYYIRNHGSNSAVFLYNWSLRQVKFPIYESRECWHMQIQTDKIQTIIYKHILRILFVCELSKRLQHVVSYSYICLAKTNHTPSWIRLSNCNHYTTSWRQFITLFTRCIAFHCILDLFPNMLSICLFRLCSVFYLYYWQKISGFWAVFSFYASWNSPVLYL